MYQKMGNQIFSDHLDSLQDAGARKLTLQENKHWIKFRTWSWKMKKKKKTFVKIEDFKITGDTL